MPAPYRKKDSVLEMSDREREARRLAELARPGRDALEGVYPEQFLVPAGAAALSKIKKALTPNKVAPKVSMPPDRMREPQGDPWKYVKGGKQDPLELLRKKEKAVARKEFDDAVDLATTRAQRRWGAEFSARESSAQNENERSSTKYKKGGAVKANKHRGDGIAQRGKTRGRII